jgi:hypothetical protein
VDLRARATVQRQTDFVDVETELAELIRKAQ